MNNLKKIFFFLFYFFFLIKNISYAEEKIVFIDIDYILKIQI